MRPIHSLVIAGLAPLLVNCSTHPLIGDVTRATVPDIVKHIRCEAKQAVMEDDLRSKNANVVSAIAYEFTFQIAENNNATGDITGSILFANGGNFSLAANADSKRQRFSNRYFKIVDSFDELRKADCSPQTLEKNLIYPIAGDIGIHEVVTTFANLQNIANLTSPIIGTPQGPPPPPIFDPTKEPTGVFRFADTLTFMTTFNGGVNPTLTLSPVTNAFRVNSVNAGPGTGPSLTPPSGLTPVQIADLATPQTGLVAQRQDTHTVVISLAGVPNMTNTHRSNARISAPATNHAITSTTSLQLQATAKERALFELDRQRMLALQQQARTVLVLPQ
jgi:hypothetical protein